MAILRIHGHNTDDANKAVSRVGSERAKSAKYDRQDVKNSRYRIGSAVTCESTVEVSLYLHAMTAPLSCSDCCPKMSLLYLCSVK